MSIKFHLSTSKCHDQDILTLHQPIRLQHFERGNENYIILDGLESSTHAILLASRAIYPCIAEKEPSNIIHIGLCVSSYFGEAKRNRDRLPAAILSVYKQRVRSARMSKVIIVCHYSGRAIIISLPWNTRFYFGHQMP